MLINALPVNVMSINALPVNVLSVNALPINVLSVNAYNCSYAVNTMPANSFLAGARTLHNALLVLPSPVNILSMITSPILTHY